MSRHKILVVEDHPQSARMLVAALQAERFDAQAVADPASAFDLIQASCPDLMIVDFNLPHADGLQLVRWIRQEPALSHLPVLLCSALPIEDDPEVRASGCKAFLRKPIDTRRLAATVRRHLPA